MAPEPRHRWSIDTILDRVDLATLLDELAEPAGSGRIRKWHCPVRDHSDDHASVTMHQDGRGHERWRCWSGDNSHRGDAVDLVQIARGTDRTAAIEWLAGRAGIRPDAPLPPPAPRRPSSPALTRPDPAVIRYLQACHHILDTTAGRPVREWLHGRGLRDEVLRANLVGADPGRHRLPRPRGLPSGATVGATFPALDQTGAPTYVQTRYLEPPPQRSKYDNPAAYRARNPRMAWTIPVRDLHDGLLVVCEGMPDALTAAQDGHLAVAVLGSTYPDLSVATRLASRARHDNLALVAVIDADDAGRQWGAHLGELLDHHDISLHLLEPPEGLDLNSWAQRDPDWETNLPILDTPSINPPVEPPAPAPAPGIELDH